jgi:outer membrane protein, heavy metal efflux system
MGTERMGSAMIGFSVPIFAGRRQLRMREEAAAMESMAGSELAAVRAEVDSRIGQLLADLERARTLITLYRNDVIPQVEASVESSFSSYRVGAVDFMTLVDAQMTANRYEQELYALFADYGRAVAELEATVGRALPATTELMAEVP